MSKKNQKYQRRAKRTKTKDFNFKSQFEFDVFKQLKGLVNPNIPTDINYESYSFPYSVPSNYICDFSVSEPSGKTIHIETKGYFNAKDRQKLLQVKKENPDIDLRLVFMQDNKIHPKSKTRYSDWAEDHGFPWAIKKVPNEWIKELYS